jgi:D-glycero-alpha-D-manno-heptose-7-phosphate kinase
MKPASESGRTRIRARAPLRLGLAGGGSDLSPYCDEYGGVVLNATIDRFAYAILEPLSDPWVEFVAADLQREWRGDSIHPLDTSMPLGLHAAVHNRIMRTFNGGRPMGVRLTTFADAPPGSGLGTSSTLIVAMIKAYTELLSLPLGEYETAHLAYEIERVDMALAGGRQDQYAATFGGFNFIEFYAGDRVVVNPLRVKNWIMAELEASSVLCFTGVSRDSASIIQLQRRHIEQHAAAELEAMHRVKKAAVHMKEALLRGDFDGMAEAMRQGWEAKKNTASTVSNSQIDRTMDVAFAAGARAGKVSGAGGGGFLMLLVDPARRMDVQRALTRHGTTVASFRFSQHGTQGWRVN